MFANFVLADEINRAPAKVQSALLEVMAEHQVSIGGKTFAVPEPFLVLATQNPIESEGVYPLPEAQRDRFLMKIVVGYPSPAEEVEIVHRMGVNPPQATEVLGARATSSRLQDAADDVYVDHGVVDYAVNLVLATRDPARYGLPELDRSSPTAPAPAPASASSPPAGPSPCCGAAPTSCPRTSSTSPPTSCATASCSPTRRWPRASPSTRSSPVLLARCPRPAVAPSQDPARQPRRRRPPAARRAAPRPPRPRPAPPA